MNITISATNDAAYVVVSVHTPEGYEVLGMLCDAAAARSVTEALKLTFERIGNRPANAKCDRADMRYSRIIDAREICPACAGTLQWNLTHGRDECQNFGLPRSDPRTCDFSRKHEVKAGG